MSATGAGDGGVRVGGAPNPARDAALALYRGIEDDYRRAIEATGVSFAPRDVRRERARALMARIEAADGRVRNGGASVASGFLSRACAACTGACVSRSFALTNNCHRDCFFCFNPNQEEFAYYCENPFPWRRQLDDLAAEGEPPACVALTGGEPLLMPDEAVAFFARARELFPDAHRRLYTAGDLLDRALLERLCDAGLDEVRFSVKHDDPPAALERVLGNLALARGVIGTVMVEMPVIPGTEDFMRGLLRRLDALGVDGVNLLEFCYPLWNWPVYESLGLTLRNPPYRVFFDYSYAGALAVEGSEEACLALMLWAREEGLDLGLHYCSLENKHRAQVRNVNEPHRGADARYAFDYGDFFLKAGVVFGPDRAPVRAALGKAGCADFLEDDAADATTFHPRWLTAAAAVRRPDGDLARPCVSSCLAVDDGGGLRLRELKLEPLEDAAPVQLDDVTAAADAAAGVTCWG